MKKVFSILFILAGMLSLSCYNEPMVLEDEIYHPEIVVRQGSLQLSSGGTATINNTLVGSSTTTTFVIENTGKEYLKLTGSPTVEISGSSDYSVTLQPSDTIAPFSYKTFNVVFTPSGAGTITSTMTIRSNDPAAGIFSVTLSGDGTTAIAPEIEVTGIATGGTLGMGSSTVGTPVGTVTVTINNFGTAVLTLTNPPTIEGADSSDFSVSAIGDTTVDPGGSTTFTVDFTPAYDRLETARILIQNDDSTENPYVINLTGTGLTVFAPDIKVRLGSSTGLLIPSGSGTFDFGEVNVGSSGSTITFCITNPGNAALTVSNPTVTGADFHVASFPASPIAAGGSSTFYYVFITDSFRRIKCHCKHNQWISNQSIYLYCNRNRRAAA